MPVEDTADERGDELDLRFGAGDGLGEGEKEGEVAMDALFFKDFGGLDAFPCGGDLDQDAVAGNAFLFVGGDQFQRFCDGAFGVEGKAGVHFGGDAAGDDFQDLKAEEDEDAVEDRVGEGLAGEAAVLMFGDGLVDQRAVFLLGRGLEDEGRVGGCILRLEFLHRLEIAGIGDNGGELLELVELCHDRVERKQTVATVNVKYVIFPSSRMKDSGTGHESDLQAIRR